MCCYLFLLQLLACHVDDRFFQLSKLIMCNGHATALVLVISLVLSFTYGFAFRLKLLPPPCPLLPLLALLLDDLLKHSFKCNK
jgi:hypothetical protein